MKTLGMIAAAAAAMLMAPAAASAAPVSAPTAPALATAMAATAQVRVVVRDDRGRRGYRGNHGRRAHWRTVCTRKWRHGRSYRVCRKVRGWR
ncbi:MAG: hypothetical protein V4808_08890 [Pseudomonadota bacterium]